MNPTQYINPWLTIARRRRLQEELRILYIGAKYRDCAKSLTKYAYESADWQDTFAIYTSIDPKEQIESIEVQEMV